MEIQEAELLDAVPWGCAEYVYDKSDATQYAFSKSGKSLAGCGIGAVEYYRGDTMPDFLKKIKELLEGLGLLPDNADIAFKKLESKICRIVNEAEKELMGKEWVN